MLHYARVDADSEARIFIAVSDLGVCCIALRATRPEFCAELSRHAGDWSCHSPDQPLIREAVRQLAAYFRGLLTEFDLPLDMRGTPFQRRVWDALLTIPYGATRTYADIARQIGSPTAFRAVGAANGANPVPIVVPCHRVIATGGGLGGFACGIDYKLRLLEL